MRNVAEYLDLDLESETWHCHECGHNLGPADQNWKKKCRVNDRSPEEVHQPILDGEYTFAPDPEWLRIVEFYCPNCMRMIENEYLPPGHPITFDMELDIEKAREKYLGEKV
jgi:acetophenone carboxylase